MRGKKKKPKKIKKVLISPPSSESEDSDGPTSKISDDVRAAEKEIECQSGSTNV